MPLMLVLCQDRGLLSSDLRSATSSAMSALMSDPAAGFAAAAAGTVLSTYCTSKATAQKLAHTFVASTCEAGHGTVVRSRSHPFKRD